MAAVTVAAGLGGCAGVELESVDEQACDAIGHAVREFIEGEHRSSVAFAGMAVEKADRLDREDLAEAIADVAAVAPDVRFNDAGFLLPASFELFGEAISTADKVCIRHRLM